MGGAEVREYVAGGGDRGGPNVEIGDAADAEADGDEGEGCAAGDCLAVKEVVEHGGDGREEDAGSLVEGDAAVG